MKDRWSQLSMSEKSDLMSLYIKNGISSLEEIKKHYNSYQVGGPVSKKTPNFVQRFNEGNKRDIPFQGGHATHLLSYAERDGKYYVFPEVQPTDYNNSNSPLQYYGRDWRVAFDRAYDNNDYLEFDTEEAARNYSENYKKIPNLGAVLNGPNRGNYNILDYMRGFATGGQIDGPDYPPNPRVGVVGIDPSLVGSAVIHAKPLQPIMQKYNEEMARSRGNSYSGTKGDEIKRKRLNDTPTAHESQDMEDAMHQAMYPRNIFGETPRVTNKLKYTIPYIYDKEIKINGHRTSENILDTLYKYSQETGLPFVDALGLAGQETGYGSMPFMNIVNEDNGFDLFTGLTAKEENRILANTNYFRNYGVIPANNLVRDFAWEIGTDMSEHPLIHAFNYFKAGKYNPGDPKHTSDVRRTGERALNTPAVQAWMERNGITFAKGGHLYQDGGPYDDKYSFLRREPEVAVADNTRVQLNPSNLFEQQVQQAIIAEEERKAQAEFERRQARRAKNEAEARAREAERRAKTPAILREPTVGEISARFHPELVLTNPINTGTIYDKSRAELEEQAANWGRSVGSVATMTPEMVSRNPITAVALGGLGEMSLLGARYPFINPKNTLTTLGEIISPSTYTELLGMPSTIGNLANTALGADIAYHSIQDLPKAAESFRLNNNLGSGLRTGLDLLGVSPIYSMGKAGVGLIGDAANAVILSQRTPNTLTRVIGSGTIGLEDAILTAGYLRGNPNGGITTAKNLNRRYLPKLKQAGASQGLYDRFASNALTEKDYEWLHKNMPEDWFINPTQVEEGVISLRKGVLPQTYKEYLQMYRSANPKRTNIDIRTGEGLTSEDIAYNWAGENEPTFAVSEDIAKEMGYDYENILNNSLFRGDYAVQVKNARTHGVSGNNFPTGAHLDEHWSLKYPLEWNNPDVSFYKAHNIPLFNKKVYTRINPVKELGLDQAMQEARNARIEVPEVLSAREPFEMSNIPNWREIFSNYNPNTTRTVRTTTQSTEFNPDIFDFNKGNTDTRFEFFEPWKFINYDLTKMSTDEVVKTFGPKAKHLKELYDVAAANNFEGKYADIAKDVELKLSKMFAIDPKDVDIVAGLARAKGIYNIPEYTERFKKYGDLGEAFIQDAKNRLDNIQLQGVSRNFKITGQHGLEGGASTTPHPIQPTITLSNDNRSSVIRELTTHEANHAAHGTKYQPKWMEVHNEKIRPVPKKNRKDFTNFDKYLDEMDELVERSKTAVEYAHETRLEGETLDQALDRVFEVANRDVYNSKIPSDIRQMVKNYTKDSVLKFWKQFLGGIALPTYISTRNEG